MCDIPHATHVTNLPGGSGQWGEGLPTFIPAGNAVTVTPAEAVAVLRAAAEREAEPLRGMMLDQARAIEEYHVPRQPGLFGP